jgi:hypothetical protein
MAQVQQGRVTADAASLGDEVIVSQPLDGWVERS